MNPNAMPKLDEINNSAKSSEPWKHHRGLSRTQNMHFYKHQIMENALLKEY